MHILKSKLCGVNKQKDNKKAQSRGEVEKETVNKKGGRKSGGFPDRLFSHVTVERLQSIRRVAPS